VDLAKRYLKLNDTVIAAVASVLCLFVPIQMASQNWDDHDRSDRYMCRDFGKNYLMSLQDKGNPVIFTNGDNDTFPLWYDQEVEGVRTDARVCNLSYIQTDWYIDQMKRPAYNSPSLPITWDRLDFCSGTNEYVEVRPEAKEQLMEFYKSDPQAAKAQFGDNPFELKNILKYWVRSKNAENHFIPTDTVYVTIDKEAVKKSGMLMASDSIPDKMTISLAGKNALYKGDLMLLELIAQSNWTRPLYIATSVGEENYINISDNFVKEGLVYRITPFTTNKNGAKNFDTERAYNNVMNRFCYGGLSKPGLYIDPTIMRMCWTHRHLFAELALNLIAENKFDKAKKVLAKHEKEIPSYNVPLTFISGAADIAKAYALLGMKAKAKQYLDAIWKNSTQYASWYIAMPYDQFNMNMTECLKELYIMQQCLPIYQMLSNAEFAKHKQQTNNFMMMYQGKGGTFPQQQ
jgi:hypothetical protein